MNTLLGIIGVLAVVFLVLPAFLPARARVSRSIDINVPVSTVFFRLTDLREYSKWNPFFQGDATVKSSVSGSGLGSSLSWEGKKCGTGKMTVTKMNPDQLIQHKLEFYRKGFGSGVGFNEWKTEKSGVGTHFTWSYEQDLPYLMRGFGLLMNKQVGKKFEDSLSNFKNLIESTPGTQTVESRPL